MSPERRQELAKLERGLGSALTRIAIIGTVIAAVVYGAIPVVLIAITTAWIRARRAAQAEIAAHVA